MNPRFRRDTLSVVTMGAGSASGSGPSYHEITRKLQYGSSGTSSPARRRGRGFDPRPSVQSGDEGRNLTTACEVSDVILDLQYPDLAHGGDVLRVLRRNHL